jgi:hypothetical protein
MQNKRNKVTHRKQERTAILHQLHRAILTSPTPIPNTIFTFSVLDTPRPNLWSFTRSTLPNDLPNTTYWLMPHFSSWSWPKAFIGSLSSALDAIAKIEEETSWEKKIRKVVWRGTVFFNSVQNLNLRPKLMQVTKGKEWADVEGLEWQEQGYRARNSIDVEGFCRYRYIVYTEVSFSALFLLCSCSECKRYF